MEIWLVIEEAPRYSVSNYGRVRNNKTGRILKSGPNSGGYSCVALMQHEGRPLQRRVHRLVMNAFCPTTDLDLDVNHIDRDKSNNEIWNLEWITHEDNMRHSSQTGHRTRARGRIKIVETGQEFSSISACARSIGGERRGVDRCLSGQSESYRGYHFEFLQHFS